MRKPRYSKRTASVTSLALFSTLSSASFLSSLQPRNLLSLASTATNSSSSTLVTTVSGSKVGGRYGHQSLYLAPPLNQLVLIGGQLDTNDSTAVKVTNNVLKFNVGSTFLYGDDRPMSAIPDNPGESTDWEQGLQASAFMSGTVDSQDGTVWLFGGIESGQCPKNEDSNVIRSFNFNDNNTSSRVGGWDSPSFSPRLPPRRRQAQMIPVMNLTTLSTDLWVLGGIADEYSCSSSQTTVGYVGLDRYSTELGQVESIAWNSSSIPVSDYSAELLEDGTSIVVIGGQTSQGELVGMQDVLVFNVESREWYTKTALGDVPTPRMGHITVPLSSGSILVHGGLSSSHVPLSDLYLLTPPSLTHLSQFSSDSLDPWVWKRLSISNDSMNSPGLAYHAASQVYGDTIIVSFGLDDTTNVGGQGGEASDKIWFLELNELDATFSWKDTFEGNQAQVDQALSSSSSSELDVETVQSSRLRKRLTVDQLNKDDEVKAMVKRVEVIANPKHDTTTRTDMTSTTTTQAVAAQTGWYGSDNQQAKNSVPSAISYSSSSSSSSTRSSSVVSPTSSSSPVSSNSNIAQDSSSSSSSKSTTLGASIGGTLGALALLSIAVVLIRRRAASKRNSSHFINPMTPDMSSDSTMQGGGGGGGPPVSSLMYTRPVQRRMLSLGSTISELPSEHGTIRAVEGGESTVDPFSDDYNVNELGQLARSTLNVSNSTTRGDVGEGGASNSLLQRSKSSVTSIPFLSTINRDLLSSNSPSSQNDVYTSPAPTLSSRRSMRRASQQLPSLPIPGTPAELIGLAVTSDDGHEGLPYRNESVQQGGGGGKNGKGEAWETFLQNQPAQPQLQAGGQTEFGGGIPAVLRPATPLRVRNADPFADQ